MRGYGDKWSGSCALAQAKDIAFGIDFDALKATLPEHLREELCPLRFP